jgi:hypothetical protein
LAGLRSGVVERLENKDRPDRGELEFEAIRFCNRVDGLILRYQLLVGFVKIYWELQDLDMSVVIN